MEADSSQHSEESARRGGRNLETLLHLKRNPDSSAAAGGLEDVQGPCLTVRLIQSIRKSHPPAEDMPGLMLQREHALDWMDLSESESCDPPCLLSVQLDQEAR